MLRLALMLLVAGLVVPALQAQQGAVPPPPPPPPPAANLQGCVSRLPNLDRYVLATQNRCALLQGSFKPEQIADRLVSLRGVLIEPAGMNPLTLRVERTLEVKNACTQTCVLEPPGTRGIHGKERPGTEGGPPGIAKPTPPQ